MKVILIKDVKGIGKKNDVIEVKEGYFLNFLYPKGIAVKATIDAINRVKQEKKKVGLILEKNREEAKIVKEKLDSAVVNLKVNADGDKLYAAVKIEDVIEAIFQAFKIRLKKNHFKENFHIKKLGKHKIDLKLIDGVEVQMFLDVIAK